LEQLRQDIKLFTDLDTEIVVIAPDTLGNARDFFSRYPVPFTALVDDSLEVYQQFDVQSRLISLGQRPGLFIIDKEGIVRFAYIGMQQWEIPANAMVLEKLRELEFHHPAISLA
jgi:peroxiredoxin Q/BCP